MGLPCWYVNGGATGNAFSLALGGKVLRDRPLWPDKLDDEFSTHEGQGSLYVWCSWRLDGSSEAIASSDQEPDVFLPSLKSLVGKRVSCVDVKHGACDLSIQFEEVVLHVFCDHVLPDPSFDGNWEATIGETAVAVGPGFKIEIEPAHSGN